MRDERLAEKESNQSFKRCSMYSNHAIFLNSRAVRSHARKKCHHQDSWIFSFRVHKFALLILSSPRAQLGAGGEAWGQTSHAPWLWEANTVSKTSPAGICHHFQQRRAFIIITATKIQRAKANRDGNSGAGVFLWNSSVVKRPTVIHGFISLGYFPLGKYWTLEVSQAGLCPSSSCVEVLTLSASKCDCRWNTVFKEVNKAKYSC